MSNLSDVKATRTVLDGLIGVNGDIATLSRYTFKNLTLNGNNLPNTSVTRLKVSGDCDIEYRSGYPFYDGQSGTIKLSGNVGTLTWSEPQYGGQPVEYSCTINIDGSVDTIKTLTDSTIDHISFTTNQTSPLTWDATGISAYYGIDCTINAPNATSFTYNGTWGQQTYSGGVLYQTINVDASTTLDLSAMNHVSPGGNPNGIIHIESSATHPIVANSILWETSSSSFQLDIVCPLAAAFYDDFFDALLAGTEPLNLGGYLNLGDGVGGESPSGSAILLIDLYRLANMTISIGAPFIDGCFASNIEDTSLETYDVDLSRGYGRDGTVNSKPRYSKDIGNPTGRRITWNSGAGAWEILDGSTRYYYAVENVAYPWLVTTWTPDEGVLSPEVDQFPEN